MLAQKHGIPKIQFTDHMKLRKKEDQSVGASDLLRKRKQMLREANVETKCRIETEGNAIQKFSYLGIYPRYSHQTPTLLWMLRRAC